MGKLLRVLTVFIFLLSIAALVLGILLFNKRELLKGRTQKLERTIIQLGPITETDDAEIEQIPQYPARDRDEVTAQQIENPTLSTFWNTYNHALEEMDNPTMRVDEMQLKNYYKTDRITGKIERDPATGFPITEGPGTMQEVLDELVNNAADQLDRLNRTREELRKLREEYIDCVRELNRRKQDLRSSLNEIVQLNNRIAQLEQEIRDKEQTIAEQQDEIRGLNDDIADRDRNISILQETLEERDLKIVDLEKRIENLLGEIERAKGFDAIDGPAFAGKINPGAKGEVASINAEWGFTVLSLQNAFLEEILGPDMDGEVPNVDLYVRRPDKADGSTGDFVTKLRLRQIRRDEKLGIADIMTNWQQLPIKTGDVIFVQ